MKKIKVLHFYKKSIIESFGGVEKFIDILCNGTNKLGVENVLFSLSKKNYNKKIDLGGYSVFNAKEDLYIYSTGFSLSAFFQFRKLSENADIIHYHFPNPFADILHFFCGIKKPFLITYHSDVVKQKFIFFFYKFMMNKFLKASNTIVVTSKNYLESSITLKRFTHKAKVISIGLDIDTYPEIDKKIYKKYKNKFTSPFFLFIGGLRYYKGLHIALEAIAGTNLKLVIAGTGGEESNLKRKAKAFKLDNVTFLGQISEKEKVTLLKLCTCFLFPSHRRSEAFGIALLEAAAFGKPMISCDIKTGTSFINLHKETGLVVKPDSSKDLKKAMQFIISNPDLAKKMSQKAKERYKKIFSAEKQANDYFNIYELLTK